MSPWTWTAQLTVGMLLCGGVMNLLWLVAWRRNDASVVDVGWTANLGMLGILYAVTSDAPSWRAGLIATLIGLWSLRLTWYLLVNRVIGRAEDGRYARLREGWGHRAHVYFWLYFQAQAVLAVIFSLPLLAPLYAARETWGWPESVGVAIWLTAVVGESLADAQLARFRADPRNRGRTCRAGLWRYSRHPNYFFEWLHWWTYVALAVGSPTWWLAWIAPGLMFYFLWRVTGIPATEAQALASRGDDYRAYQHETSPFIPWFPRRSVP